MNKLSTAKRAQIVKALVEGNSLRSITRMVGCSINTVTKLLVDLGTACEAFHDEHVSNVPSQRVQCDEIWTFCYARRENVPDEYKGVFGFGDLWTWVGQDADSKLVLSWRVGRRDIGMQPHRHVVDAALLDGLRQVDLALLDVQAVLFEGRSDVGVRDRPE